MAAQIPEGRCALRRLDQREGLSFRAVQASEPAYDILVVHVPCADVQDVAEAGSVLAASDWGVIAAARDQFGPLPRPRDEIFVDEERRARDRSGVEAKLVSLFQNGVQPPRGHPLLPDHRVQTLDQTWIEQDAAYFGVRLLPPRGATPRAGVEAVTVASNRLFRVALFRRGEADLTEMQQRVAAIVALLLERLPNDPSEPDLNTWIAKRAKTLVKPDGFCLYDASVPADARRLFLVPRGTKRLLAMADCGQLSSMRQTGLGIPGIHVFVYPGSAGSPSREPSQLALNTSLSRQMRVVTRSNEADKLGPALVRFFGGANGAPSALLGIVALDPTGAFFVEVSRQSGDPYGDGDFVAVQGLVWVHGEIVLVTSTEPYEGPAKASDQVDRLRAYARQLRLANN